MAALALMLAACQPAGTGTGPGNWPATVSAAPSAQDIVTGLQATLAAADQGILTYATLPRCKPGGPALCSKGTVVAALKVASHRAYDAVKTAGVMVVVGGDTFNAAVANARTALADLQSTIPKR